MNGQALVDRAKLRFADSGGVLLTDPEWLDHLNAVYRPFRREIEGPIGDATATLTFTAGQASEALPAGVHSVIAVRNNTDDYVLHPLDSWKEIFAKYPDPAEQGAVFDYHVSAGRVYLFQVPDAAVTLEVIHEEEPPAVTLATDPDLPESYQEFLVEGMLATAYRDHGMLDRAAMAKGAHDEGLLRAKRELAVPGVDRYPTIPDEWYGPDGLP